MSRDAALLLKARICLYEGTWRRYRNVEGDVKFLEEAYKASGELMGYGYELYKASGIDDSYFDLFIQDNYNDNSEVILSREYDPALNMGHNVLVLRNTCVLTQESPFLFVVVTILTWDIMQR